MQARRLALHQILAGPLRLGASALSDLPRADVP